MQMIIAIPRDEELKRFGGTREALMREVCGVPLLVRVLATGMRAGAEHALIVHREELSPEIEAALRESKFLSKLQSLDFVKTSEFEPASAVSWQRISALVEGEFLWLPWNWVTNKYGLSSLKLIQGRPQCWNRPLRLTRWAALSFQQPRLLPNIVAEGCAVRSPYSVSAAERWLVAHSGKPLDGIYSKFNRWLCRPLVRVLTHTPVSPNMVTFAGLLVAILSAYLFAQGSYLAALAGALLFFASGLLDEVDGMLARIRFSDSAFGTWLEGTVDNVTYFLLFAGITFGLYQRRGPQEVLIGEVALVGSILAVLVISWQRKRSTRSDRPQEYLGNVCKLLEKDQGNWVSKAVREVHIFLKKGVLIHYVLLFTALGLLPVLLRLAAFASNLTWILALYFSHRFFRRKGPGAGAVELYKAA